MKLSQGEKCLWYENRILNYKEYDELYKISCIEKSIDSV